MSRTVLPALLANGITPSNSVSISPARVNSSSTPHRLPSGVPTRRANPIASPPLGTSPPNDVSEWVLSKTSPTTAALT